MIPVFVFLGGGIGAVLRYGMTLLLGKVNPAYFPTATFVSNFLASLLLGIFLVLFREKTHQSESFYAFFAIGICGGFSTFSSFAKENLDLFEKGHVAMGCLNILVSITLCIAAVYFGKRMV